ncbi:MAG: hypothetical protein KA436_11100 [Oligoflexales bacterium]|nr:hypothetical protein [Oligoflexales bacterium]
MANKEDSKKSAKENARFYSYILIDKTQSWGLKLLLFFMYPVFLFFMAKILVSGQSWQAYFVPILFCGILISIYPLTESWIYRPWQAKARKHERHYLD